MTPVANVQAHALMNRTDAPSGHSTKPQGRATATAFSSYGFGPLDTGKANKGVKPVTGNYGQSQPAAAGSLDWITQLQATTGVKTGF